MALNKLVDGIVTPMTPQEEADFLADQAAQTSAINAEQTAESNFRQQLITALQSISGKTYDTITANEVRLLVAILVHKQFKGIDKATRTYKPPSQWVV